MWSLAVVSSGLELRVSGFRGSTVCYLLETQQPPPLMGRKIGRPRQPSFPSFLFTFLPELLLLITNKNFNFNLARAAKNILEQCFYCAAFHILRGYLCKSWQRGKVIRRDRERNTGSDWVLFLSQQCHCSLCQEASCSTHDSRKLSQDTVNSAKAHVEYPSLSSLPRLSFFYSIVVIIMIFSHCVVTTLEKLTLLSFPRYNLQEENKLNDLFKAVP